MGAEWQCSVLGWRLQLRPVLLPQGGALSLSAGSSECEAVMCRSMHASKQLQGGCWACACWRTTPPSDSDSGTSQHMVSWIEQAFGVASVQKLESIGVEVPK